MFDSLFDNPGQKLRDISIFLFVLELIGIFIWAIVMWCDGTFFGGLLILVFGFLSAYISTLILLAIADAAENSSVNCSRLYQLMHNDRSIKPQSAPVHVKAAVAPIPVESTVIDAESPVQESPKTPTNAMIICPNCGKSQYSRKTCFHCGHDLT